MGDTPSVTVTELWIASLQKKRAQDIAAGRYFDGRERENVVSFDRAKAEQGNVWDSFPSDCNPE